MQQLNNEEVAWAILIYNDAEDYIIADTNLLKYLPNKERTKPLAEYNQKRFIKDIDCSRFCVMFANFAALWDTVDVEFEDDYIYPWLVDARDNYWWKDKVWMIVYKWTDCTRRNWNKLNPDNQVRTYRTTKGSAIYNQLFDKWYTFVCSRTNNNMQTLDSQDDWKINQSFSDKKYDINTNWHCIRTWEENAKMIIDNYKWVFVFNKYEWDITQLDNYNWNVYVYINNKQFMDAQKAMTRDAIINEKAKVAFDNWFWNWLWEWNPATRGEVAIMVQAMFEKLKQ